MKKTIPARASKTSSVQLGKVLHVIATAIRKSEARRAAMLAPGPGSRAAAAQRLVPQRRGAT